MNIDVWLKELDELIAHVCGIGGYKVYVSLSCVEPKTTPEHRAKGGYLNRWLILVPKKTVMVPCCFISDTERAIYMHPDLHRHLVRQTHLWRDGSFT